MECQQAQQWASPKGPPGWNLSSEFQESTWNWRRGLRLFPGDTGTRRAHEIYVENVGKREVMA